MLRSPRLRQGGKQRAESNLSDSTEMPGVWVGQAEICRSGVLDARDLAVRVSSPICLEIVRAMTYVINQGLALYWGTSRWGAAEIMVSVLPRFPLSHNRFPLFTWPLQTPSIGGGGRGVEGNGECFLTTPLSLSHPTQEAYSVARQFNLIPPVCEQAEHHLFQREKVEMQLPELYHKIGSKPPRPYLSLELSITWIPFPTSNPLPLRRWLSHLVPSGLWPHH